MTVYALAPMTMQGLPTRIVAKLIVAVDTGCWLWQGSIEHHGYGRIKFEGKPQYVHRVVWKLLRGSIPRGRELGHLRMCPRSCCNPRHLRPITHAQNIREKEHHGDRGSDGRWRAA